MPSAFDARNRLVGFLPAWRARRLGRFSRRRVRHVRRSSVLDRNRRRRRCCRFGVKSRRGRGRDRIRKRRRLGGDRVRLRDRRLRGHDRERRGHGRNGNHRKRHHESPARLVPWISASTCRAPHPIECGCVHFLACAKFTKALQHLLVAAIPQHRTPRSLPAPSAGASCLVRNAAAPIPP